MGLLLLNLTYWQEFSVMPNGQTAIWPEKDQLSVSASYIFHGPPVAHAWPTEIFTMVILTIGLMARVLMPYMQDPTFSE
jgi:hypothetical protein